MFPLLCRSNKRGLVIILSKHPFISFVLHPFSYKHSIFVSVYHILQLSSFDNVSVVTPSMIWVSICYITRVKMNTLQPMICFKISLLISRQNVEFTYRKRSPTFSPTIFGNGWILLSPKTVFELGECCQYQSSSYRFGVTCFDDNSACNNNCCSRQSMILHKTITRK